jgi:hypothetical protein
MKRLNKCNLENLQILGEVLYNITGLEYYINLNLNYYTSVAMCGTYRGAFFSFYFDNLKLLKTLINNGETFKFPLCNLDENDKRYIYNSL